MTYDICRIEELSLNAWPALKQVLYDGWVLRFADGYTRRSNSVNPLYAGGGGLSEKIRFCQGVYRAAGQPTVFKLTAASEPPALADALAAAGYREQARTSVRVAELKGPSNAPAGRGGPPLSWDRPSEQWLAAFTRFSRIDADRQATLRAILGGIVPPACFAAVTEGEEICACGMGVLQGQWLGLFDIVTHPDRRRQGFGRRLVGALIDWGRENGAVRAYLQVMLDNPAASALYAGAGFREAYQYVYLVEPAPQGRTP